MLKQAANCTACQVAAALGANRFSFDSVLLVGEGEGNVVCTYEESDGVTSGDKDVAIAEEGDVVEAERDGFVFGAGVAVFSGLHEEVDANPDDVCNALCFGVALDVVGEDVVQDGCWERFGAFWRRVCASVAA